MIKKTYDLLIIGAGVGGIEAAIQGAKSGLAVGICEEDMVGGTSLIRGCIPKKIMMYAALYKNHLADARKYGWEFDNQSFDWHTLIQNQNNFIASTSNQYIEQLKQSGVEIINSTVEFIDQHTIKTSLGNLYAHKFLIATGGTPSLPQIEGIEHAITSDDIFDLKDKPKTIAIVGGGYIASEFASIFNGLDSVVHQIFRGEDLMRGFDTDLTKHITSEMAKQGVVMHPQSSVDRITKLPSSGKICLHTTQSEQIEVDQVMYATGRCPNISRLGLESLGIKINDGGLIEVSKYYQTNIEHIFAIGDVCNRIHLAPIAINDARMFIKSNFPDPKYSNIYVDNDILPSAVFSIPEVASVGVSEDEARAQYSSDIKVLQTSFTTLYSSIAQNKETSLIKIIVHGDKVVGAHMISREASDIIQIFATAMQANVTYQDICKTQTIHPSIAEHLINLFHDANN